MKKLIIFFKELINKFISNNQNHVQKPTLTMQTLINEEFEIKSANQPVAFSTFNYPVTSTNVDYSDKEKYSILPQTYDEKLSKLDELFKRTKNYKQSSNYIEALEFVSKLKNIAPFNAWLLRGQNPNLTYVATANEWAEKFDRAIKIKSNAYIVLKSFGPVDFVYDIKDTIGERDLPEDLQSHFRAKGDIKNNYILNIEQCCKKKKIQINYDDTIVELRHAGWAAHTNLQDTKIISINNDHSSEVKFSTLCHELAHLMLGHLGKFLNCECKERSNLSDEVMELEAESVSWLVCNRLGLSTDADKYLSNILEGANSKMLLSEISIDNILTTAGRIESMALKKSCTIKKTKMPNGYNKAE